MSAFYVNGSYLSCNKISMLKWDYFPAGLESLSAFPLTKWTEDSSMPRTGRLISFLLKRMTKLWTQWCE